MKDALIGGLFLGLLTVIAVLVSALKGRGQQVQRKNVELQNLEIENAKSEAKADVAKATDDELSKKLGDVLGGGAPPGKLPDKGKS